jgi:hypothetical protein
MDKLNNAVMHHFIRYEILLHMSYLSEHKQDWHPGKIAEYVLQKNSDVLCLPMPEEQIKTFLELKKIALKLIEEQCAVSRLFN